MQIKKSLLGPNIRLRTLFSNTLSLRTHSGWLLYQVICHIGHGSRTSHQQVTNNSRCYVNYRNTVSPPS